MQLVGPVADKAKLENYYARAKVFALSSYSEGSPNVIGEALRNGCYIITSKISVCKILLLRVQGLVLITAIWQPSKLTCVR
ncbi:glycosyltransferase [Ligilactobacillus agilis]|uniref:glycosyltransferase n=1 Tax=Ligilactobacillus agilis TaxID=1601 RepID=UPI0009EA017B